MARMPRAERTVSAGDGSVRVLGEISQLEQSQEILDDSLTAKAIDEIRQLKHPPVVVRRMLEVIHLVLHARKYRRGIPRDGIKWESVLRTITSEGLAYRLRAFDIAELRQTPQLARDLRDHYFQPYEASQVGPQPLSPERVRRASTSVCTLFAWAARTVEAAIPVIDQASPSAAELISTASETVAAAVAEAVSVNSSAVGCESVEDHVSDDDETLPITVGVWATCPGGHGLEVGVGAMGESVVCVICSNLINRGGDSASCRLCRFFVCTDCRRGSWLSAHLLRVFANSTDGDDLQAADSSNDRRAEIIGFRWLRQGDEFPEPLASQTILEEGAAASWGRYGAAMLGDICLVFQPQLNGCSEGMVAKIGPAASQRRRSPSKRTSAFGLTDQRALNAAVLAGFCGFPGAR